MAAPVRTNAMPANVVPVFAATLLRARLSTMLEYPHDLHSLRRSTGQIEGGV
jgi:hypothetical protein